MLNDLLAHSEFALGCILAALERHASNKPAMFEDTLQTAAIWMVARHETLKMIEELHIV